MGPVLAPIPATTASELPSRPRRALLALMAFLLAFSVACSGLAVAHELHHDCTGVGCAGCAQIALGLHIGRAGTTLAVAALALALARRARTIRVLGEERSSDRLTTLVALKVQLND